MELKQLKKCNSIHILPYNISEDSEPVLVEVSEHQIGYDLQNVNVDIDAEMLMK